MRSSNIGCPVCQRQDAGQTQIRSAVPKSATGEWQDRTSLDDAVFIECAACGQFVVTSIDFVNLTNPAGRSKWNSAHVSALLREQTVRDLPRFWLRDGMDAYGPLERTDLAPIDLSELLTRWPRTVPERIDRTLCNLARLSPTGGHQVEFNNEDTAIAFAENRHELHFNISNLINYRFLQQVSQHSKGWAVIVTPEGWARFEMLTHGASAPENPVFVAMWYGDQDTKAKMDELFQNGIEPAIHQAGYDVTRVDLSQHNDWIMDKVLGDIRLAPFVVADFTGHRNGVYFEAAFARGLGIPVIHTCERGDFGKAHFDTVQLNHVLWDTPEDLRTSLHYRIVRTVGKGPHPYARPRK